MTTPLTSVLSDASVHQVSLLSLDNKASREFYEGKLGAQCLAEFDPPGLLFFKVGATRLLLDKNGKPGLVYFAVADIESAVAEMKQAGIEFEADIAAVFKDDEGLFGVAGDTEFMAFFKDPAENILALVQQKRAGD